MSDPILLPTEARPATELPLVAAQPGIWVADQISPYANAYAVSHYIELSGPLNEERLLQAIAQGLSEVDTLQLRFEERDGVPVQWHDADLAILPTEYLDLRGSPDALAAAQAVMQLDMSGDLRIGSGKALYRHMLIHLSDPALVLVSALPPYSGRWLQFYRHCPQNRSYLQPHTER
ncbi:Enterobactin synthase component F [Serratia plymuthica]|uniref:Enterobactin synthase component F n=1 Tax=Serratia plymuthica TaxID=82996 RepID=A0A2X4V0V2_SERPL|nr:Enterobactin synthase component F [Serratia plymuthica]